MIEHFKNSENKARKKGSDRAGMPYSKLVLKLKIKYFRHVFQLFTDKTNLAEHILSDF